MNGGNNISLKKHFFPIVFICCLFLAIGSVSAMDNDTVTIDNLDDSSDSTVDPHSGAVAIDSIDDESSYNSIPMSNQEEGFSPIVDNNDLVKHFGNDSQFTVKIVDNNGKPIAGQTVNFKIGGSSYNRTTDENGIAKLSINLNPGTYTIISTYNGFSVENSITVLPILIENMDIVKYYRNGTAYTVTVLDGNGNPLSGRTVVLNIKGVFYERVSDENGVAKLSINLNPGNYIITAMYNNMQVANTITVLPVISNNSNVALYYRNGTAYTVTVLDGNGNPVSGETVVFNINGVFYERVSDANGVAKLSINLNPGTYIITAIYNNMQIANNITVLPVMVNHSNIVKYYRNGTAYTVTVLDGNGNPVSGETVVFNINGVFYERVSDANGVASLSINLNPGNYIITAMYNNMQVANTIEVLMTLLTEDVIIANNDSSVYSVMVLDDNGNPAVNKTVTFKINGNTYTAVSDKNGIATLNLTDICRKSEINGINTTRTIYLSSDNIISKAKDTQMLEDCADVLRSYGYNVVIGSIGANTHYSSITNIPENGVFFFIVGGLCAGTFVDLASNYYQNKLKAKNIKFVLGCLSPPITRDLDTLEWLERSWDDNFSPSSFTGLAYPGQYLKDHDIPYIYGSAGADLANNLLSKIGGSNKYVITTEYNGYTTTNTITYA